MGVALPMGLPHAYGVALPREVSLLLRGNSPTKGAGQPRGEPQTKGWGSPTYQGCHPTAMGAALPKGGALPRGVALPRGSILLRCSPYLGVSPTCGGVALPKG